MRTTFLFLAVVSIPAMAADPSNFAVVVHSTDRVIARYLCDQDPTQQPFVYKTVVRKEGTFRWHVVGGVAPYTILKDVMKPGNTRCITVMDAEGQVATACKVMNTQEILIREGCGELEKLDFPWMGITPDSLSDSRRGKEFNGQGVQMSEVEAKKTSDGVLGPQGYKPPVKQVSDPAVPPSVKPDLSRVKPEKQREGANTRPVPPQPKTVPVHGPTGPVYHGTGGGSGHPPAPVPSRKQGLQQRPGK